MLWISCYTSSYKAITIVLCMHTARIACIPREIQDVVCTSTSSSIIVTWKCPAGPAEIINYEIEYGYGVVMSKTETEQHTFKLNAIPPNTQVFFNIHAKSRCHVHGPVHTVRVRTGKYVLVYSTCVLICSTSYYMHYSLKDIHVGSLCTCSLCMSMWEYFSKYIALVSIHTCIKIWRSNTLRYTCTLYIHIYYIILYVYFTYRVLSVYGI